MATQPTKWSIQIGVNSEKAKIPINAGADQIDLSKLYPSAYELPLDAGGNAVGRTEMNALFSTLAENIYFQQRGGVYSYDSTIDYTVGTLVLYSSNLYKCIQAHSHTTPRAPTNTSYWQKIVIQSDIANFVTLNTTQTISGAKTFTTLPVSSVTPTSATQFVNKNYADTKVSLNGDQTVGGTKTFSSSPLIPTATAGDSSAKGASTAFVQKNFVTLNTAQTISAVKNFSVLPISSVAPTGSTQLTNKSYVDTKVSLSGNQTVAGTKTFSSSPLMPTATAGDSSAKGANTAFVQNAIAQLVPTGTILAFGGVTAPKGFLICDGSAVSRTTYATLFSVIGTRYGAGNGSTTFNVPKLNDGSFVRGVSTSAVGTKYSASLPPLTASSAGAHTHTRGTMDITASAIAHCLTDESPFTTTGAFYDGGKTSLWNAQHATNNHSSKLNFQASRAWSGATSSNGAHTHTVTNSVGVAMNGNTVLPQSVGVNYIIKI